MPLILNKKWFNPLYFVFIDLLKDPTIRTILIYGGKSSSKTISICQGIVKECYVRGANAITFRKESSIIPTTLKKSINLAIDSMYMSPVFERQDRRYLCKNQAGTTSEIIMKGLDDPEKAKGIESYKYVYLDELNHFELSEYEQFNLSLRGIPGQKIIASWNPVDENSWVKLELVDKYEWVDTEHKLPAENSFVKRSKCGKVVLIRTMYLDNYWITGSPCGTYGYRDENLISEYEALASRNANSYKVNVLGEWGKTTFGGEFLKCWRSEIHTGTYPYNPDLAVHLIFDENVNPYFPCGIFQVGNDQKSIFLIHAIALKNPENKTSFMGRAIVRKLREWGHQGYVYVGGDPTSQKDDVKQEEGHDLFRIMMDELKEFKPQRRLLRSSPSVRMSAEFVNSILESELYGLKFRADKSCRVAILDFENTKEDKNGKVDKKTVIDPVTKVSYQPYGHYCFVGDTLITTDKGQIRIDQIKVGDMVLTRKGFKKVLATHNNGIKKIQTFFVGEIKIKCTPDHLFYTENGFKKILTLLMLRDIFSIFDVKTKSICKKKLLVTTEEILQDTLKVKTDRKGFIIRGELKSMVLAKKLGFMFTNTWLRLVKYLKGITFIIKMKTRLIMKLKTLNYSVINNTSEITLKKDLSIILNGQKNFTEKELQQHPNGIDQKKEGCITVNKLKLITQKESLKKKFASNAERNIKQNTRENQNSVTKTAKQWHLEDAEVFDLSIEDQPEYFANGILVHNCDIFRYMVCGTFAEEYTRYQSGGKIIPISMGRNVPSKNSY